jgi:hypothetical protein
MRKICCAPALVVAACAGAIGLIPVDAAHAGTYVIRNCNIPGEAGRNVGPWRPSLVSGTFWHDECGNGGGFGINAGTIPGNQGAGTLLETPPAVAIRRIRLWLVARLRSTSSQLFAVVVSGTATTSSPVDLFGPPGGSTLTSPYVSPLLSPETHVYLVLVNCGGANGDCPATDTNVLDIRGVETTLEESLAPTGSIAGGELFSGSPQSGVRMLAYAVGDQQSGIARISAMIGTTTVGTSDLAPECAYASIAACPSTRSGSIAADTRKVPDGIYPVSIRVTDAAGNEQTVTSPTAIQIANGTAAAQSQSSGSLNGARLTAAFAANRRSTLTVGYGRRVVVRGRLRGPDGMPMRGTSIVLEERVTTGVGSAASSTVITGPKGIFSYTARRGTSRTLTFQYRPTADGPTVAKSLRLRVKAAATLRVALRGVSVRYRGRVLSTPLPRKGKLVEIQGRAPGAAWKTFARRRTSNRGHYAGTYRLRVHRPGVRLQFRVRVPAEADYPFVAHAGRSVVRIVR